MQLSQIKYRDIFFKLSSNDLKSIVFSNYQNKDANFDYAVLFGGISMIPYRADIAINLYNKGLIKKIILTGGIGYFSSNQKDKEAYLLAKYLKENGVLKEDLIIEDKSKNTLQNVENILKVCPSIKDKKVVIITSDFHMKRCKLLMEDKLKQEVFPYVSYDGITDNFNFYNTKKGLKIIKREAFLLIYLARHKYISDLNINLESINS